MTHNSRVTDKLDTGRPVAARPAVVPPRVLPPLDLPTVLVFHDVASLVESFRTVDPGPTSPSALLDPPVVTPSLPPSPNSGPNGAILGGYTEGSRTGVNGAHSPGANGSARVNGSGTGTAGVVAPDYARPAAPAAPTTSPPVPVGTGTPVITDEERSSYGVLLDRAAERGLLDSTEYDVRLRQLAGATTTAEMVAIVSELPAFTPAPTPTAPHQSRSAIQSASRTATGSGQRRRLVVWVLMGVLVLLALVSLVILALSVGRLSRSRSSAPPQPPVAVRPVSALRL